MCNPNFAMRLATQDFSAPRPQPAHANHGDGFQHSVLFYEDDSYLLDRLVEQVGHALDSGAAVVAATARHLAMLDSRFRAAGIDLDQFAAERKYFPLEVEITLSKITILGKPDAARFVDFIGGVMAEASHAPDGTDRPVFVFGELVAVLAVNGDTESAVALEAMWNDLSETHRFTLLCA